MTLPQSGFSKELGKRISEQEPESMYENHMQKAAEHAVKLDRKEVLLLANGILAKEYSASVALDKIMGMLESRVG